MCNFVSYVFCSGLQQLLTGGKMATPSSRNRRHGTGSSDNEDIVLIATALLLDSSSSEEDVQPIPRGPRRPQRNFEGEAYTNFLLNGNPHTMADLLRVDSFTFVSLVGLIVERGHIDWNRKRLSVEVSLAMFLYICSLNHRMRTTADRFQCSTDTVHLHFKYMVRALCNVAPLVIHTPDMNEVPAKIVNDRRFNPWFENCAGAIDGTHVDAWVPTSREGRYRGRKTVKTWNVMAICSFDGKFTFVYPGWEGSAHDSRVLAAAVADEVNNFPHPLAHKFYLVDAGYPNTTGFLAPYRGQRYHKDDFDGLNTVYESAMDLFNHRHAMLRNALRGWDDQFEEMVENGGNPPQFPAILLDMSRGATDGMGNVRDGIAASMWEAYVNSH
ncbi:hypothetical protein Vadar_007940 [Vaccinium darrowii]|uniref:Uncharacterized protein n=1 Tax=Vaccinium darrowii TaxID=229202 RepID=A0ACB7XZ61_9ERIC|nr:hypothetical protein Vadar_007940 [Vaccinium darrowii]